MKTLFRTAGALVLMSWLGTAHPTLLSGGFTGNWYDPGSSGQGFQLQVLPDGRALVFWFTYDDAGNQAWLTGSNTIEGNSVEIELVRPVGARFGDDFDSDDIELVPFGTLTLSFDDCATGTATWQSDNLQFSSGTLNLQRLTSSAGVSCTASITDNRSPTESPLDFRLGLNNEGVYPQGSGHADYEAVPGRTEFEVEIEDVPTGAYELRVDGIVRGSLDVIDTADGTEGETEYSSPRDDDDLLLDFDPLNALIEVVDSGEVIFSVVLDPAAAGNNGNAGSEEAPPFGNSEVEVDFTNTGLDADASGDVELEQRTDRVEFNVEAEDLDIGTYELWVGDTQRGELQVVSVAGGTEGELEFRNPVEPGKILLDFDPRGERVAIERNGEVYLQVQFPGG